MGQVLSYPSPEAGRRRTAYTGMAFFAASWAMFFATLFAVVGALRAAGGPWPELPRDLPALATALVLTACAVWEYGLRALRRGRRRLLGPALLVALLLGAAFLGVQFLVASQLHHGGLGVLGVPQVALVLGLTGIHGLHALVGLGALAYLTARAYRGAYSTPRHLPVRVWALYWHFMAAVWLAIFLFVFAS